MEEYLEGIVKYIKEDEFDDYNPEFICIQYEIVENMEANNIGIEAVQPILKLMEDNPLVEFGTPGPLTHFIERVQKGHEDFYNKCVANSVKTKPAIHTIWLLNRIINGRSDEKTQDYVLILETIHQNDKLNKSIRNVAGNFLDYHRE